MATMVLLTACAYKEPVLPRETTAPPEKAGEVQPTEVTTEPPTQPVITAPAALSAKLEACGTCLEELALLSCKQLVTVDADGSTAQIDLYILENNQWLRQEALSCSGYVGQRGTKEQKTEGDMATPKGLFPVGQGFYIDEAPQTGLQLFQITADTYWVDDPASRYYNKRIEGTENKDWMSAERMHAYDTAYEYGFVIDYNLEAIPYAGSAIFFHVGSRPTFGCVATQKSFVLQYLAILNETENPYILIN